MYYNIN